MTMVAKPELVPSEPIDIQGILKMLPHSYPFVLIDRVLEVIPYVRAVGMKNVTINEPFFVGHFPERPVMPGVLIIESMAQTGAVLVMRSLGAHCEGKLVYFMSVEQARFRRPVVPGDQMLVRVKRLHHRGNVWKIYAVAEVENVRVADAALTAMINEHS